MPGRAGVVASLTLCLLLSSALTGQTLPYLKPPDPSNGERIYKSGCIACHGGDGQGTPQTTAGFKPPKTFPDFTKCDQTTPEPNSAWKAVIVHGGPSRKFSQIMPAFEDLLTTEEIDDVIAYMRQFCTSKHWARGELNLPRALITEKAFPEDELVVSMAVHAGGAPGFTTDIIHEQRFGVHNQLEIDVPVTAEDQSHTWYGGVGDTTFGIKREMFSSLRTGSILSLQGSVLVPTGSRERGFGSGTTTFETFAAFDQLFPTNTFLQFQIGADLPRHSDISPQKVFFRTAVGQALAKDHGLGRLFSPMVEFVADRDLVNHATTNWDVVPEMQATISRRQHIRADIGVSTPATNTAHRSPQVVFYVLWDWADGKLNEGW
jgi:mono/diheme cytochrome c family protein